MYNNKVKLVKGRDYSETSPIISSPYIRQCNNLDNKEDFEDIAPPLPKQQLRCSNCNKPISEMKNQKMFIKRLEQIPDLDQKQTTILKLQGWCTKCHKKRKIAQKL